MFDITVAEKPREVEIASDENQTNETNSIVLRSGFSTSDHRYNFEIKSDGTGEIFYSDFDGEREEFAHGIKVGKLAVESGETIREQIALQSGQDASEEIEIESIREEISTEMLEEVFWEEINQALEDPFFRSFYDDGEWGEEFQTERGTAQEFVEFLGLCILTEREIVAGNEDYLVVGAETECEAAGVSECSYYTEPFGRAC